MAGMWSELEGGALCFLVQKQSDHCNAVSAACQFAYDVASGIRQKRSIIVSVGFRIGRSEVI